LEENQSLKSEITDLKANLRINKEIIEGFFKSNTNASANMTYSTKLKEENELLISKTERMRKENEELRNKIMYYEKILNESIFQYRESTEELRNKNFILENAIAKKDNLIIHFSNKINKLVEKHEDNGTNFDKEIYVTM
jgi:hypothetical protein